MTPTTKFNTAYFLGLADLSETIAVAALDALVRRKDDAAIDAFMVAVLVDPDAFPWFLEHETFNYTRPTLDTYSGTGYDLLLRPATVSEAQPELDAWQTERLTKAIALGLALPNPTRWMMAVAHHIGQQVPTQAAVELLQTAVREYNAKLDAPLGTHTEKAHASNALQAAIDRQPLDVHNPVEMDFVSLALDHMKYGADHRMAVHWLRGMTPAEFKKGESLLFECLTQQEKLTAFMLTMVNEESLTHGLSGLRFFYDWLDVHSDPKRMADLRTCTSLRFLRDAPNADLVAGVDALQDLMGLRAPASFNHLKKHLVDLANDPQEENVELAMKFVENAINKNITELFPLIHGHPALEANHESARLVGDALDGAFGLAHGAAGATRLRETLELLMAHGHELERINDQKSAMTHLARQVDIHVPEKLAVLLVMGQDPDAPDEANETAEEVLLRQDQKDAWNRVVCAFKARKMTHGLLEEIESAEKPSFV